MARGEGLALRPRPPAERRSARSVVQRRRVCPVGRLQPVRRRRADRRQGRGGRFRLHADGERLRARPVREEGEARSDVQSRRQEADRLPRRRRRSEGPRPPGKRQDRRGRDGGAGTPSFQGGVRARPLPDERQARSHVQQKREAGDPVRAELPGSRRRCRTPAQRAYRRPPVPSPVRSMPTTSAWRGTWPGRSTLFAQPIA